MENHNESEQKEHKLEQKKQRTVNLSIFIIILSALIAITMIAIFIPMKAHQRKNAVKQQLESFTDEITNLKEQQLELHKNTNLAITNLVNEQQNLEREVIALKKSLQNQTSVKVADNGDWQLIKARNYLQLAQINAYWGNNIDTVSSLLQAADQIFAQLPDSEFYTLRQNIQEKLNTLKTEYDLDKVKILSQIDAIIELINTLPLRSIPKSEDNILTSSNTSDAEQKTFSNTLNKSLDILSKFIVIRKIDDKNLVLPQQEVLLRNRIILTLKEAEWGLLNNSPAIYFKSIDKALNEISNTFDTDDSKTKEVIEQLNSLKNINLNKEKPDFTQIINFLNNLIDKKTNNNESLPQGENNI